MQGLRRSPAEAPPLIEDWDEPTFARELPQRERVIVLFHASWCPFSRVLLPLFEKLEPESSVPFARADLRHPLDKRWDNHRIAVVPTLAYFEHGEELERIDGVRGRGLSNVDVAGFLADVEAIQHEPMLPRRMHGPRRG